MAAASEATAAELLSRFFDDIRAAERGPPAAAARSGGEVAWRCPSQDGVTQAVTEVPRDGPEYAAGRQLLQKPAPGVGLARQRGEEIAGGPQPGAALASRSSSGGCAEALRQLRPGILCRVGGKASPLWETGRIQALGSSLAVEETVAVALEGHRRSPAARGGPLELPAREAPRPQATGGPLDCILQDVEHWLQLGEQAALRAKTITAAGPASAGGAGPAGFSDHSGPFETMSPERSQIYFGDAYSRQLQEEANSNAHRQLARRGPPGGGGPPAPGGGGGGDDEDAGRGSRGSASGPRKYVLGGPLIVREMKPTLTNIHALDYITAFQLSVFHSWQSLWGIIGPDAEEGEDPRVRGLVSSSTPAVLLCELNAVASFNMMDPILSYNYEYLMEAARVMHRRTPHGNGMPGRQPLGYVVQGTGPHFCPGGNHHPVSPPGGTPLTMHTNTGSNPFIYNRECNLPSITAFTGSVIGGGIALGLQQTHRVAAASCSMAFGNISRGACPVMFLSQNLPASVGTLGAVEIYLSDGTYSACKAQRVGMVYNVLPSFVAVKTQALKVVKKMAATPALRTVNDVRNVMSWSQFQREAMGMTLAMRTGKLFANVKSARWRAPESAERAGAETPAKWAGAGPPAAGRVVSTAAPTSEVPAAEDACTQCGQRGAAGVRHGEAFFCDACWPRLGIAAPVGASGARQPPTKGVAEAVRAAEGPCGEDGLRHCDGCRGWQAKAGGQAGDGGAEVPTDASTDHTDAESGSEDTVIGSDCVTCSDAWSDVED